MPPPPSIPPAKQSYATGQDTLAYNRMKEWQDCAGNRLSSHDNMYHDGAGNPRSKKPMYPTLSQCQGYGMGKARTVNPNNWRHRSNPIITFVEAGWTDATLDGGTEMTPTYWDLPDAATIKSHGVKVGTTRDLFEFDIDSQCNDVDDHVIQNWNALSCIPCYICQMYMRNKGRSIGGNNTDPQGKTPNIGNNGPPGPGGKKTRLPNQWGRSEHTSMSCEHVLPILIMGLICGIASFGKAGDIPRNIDAATDSFFAELIIKMNTQYPPASPARDDQIDAIKNAYIKWRKKIWRYSYLWSHMECNSIKNNDPFLTLSINLSGSGPPLSINPATCINEENIRKLLKKLLCKSGDICEIWRRYYRDDLAGDGDVPGWDPASGTPFNFHDPQLPQNFFGTHPADTDPQRKQRGQGLVNKTGPHSNAADRQAAAGGWVEYALNECKQKYLIPLVNRLRNTLNHSVPFISISTCIFYKQLLERLGEGTLNPTQVDNLLNYGNPGGGPNQTRIGQLRQQSYTYIINWINAGLTADPNFGTTLEATIDGLITGDQLGGRYLFERTGHLQRPESANRADPNRLPSAGYRVPLGDFNVQDPPVALSYSDEHYSLQQITSSYFSDIFVVMKNRDAENPITQNTLIILSKYINTLNGGDSESGKILTRDNLEVLFKIYSFGENHISLAGLILIFIVNYYENFMKSKEQYIRLIVKAFIEYDTDNNFEINFNEFYLMYNFITLKSNEVEGLIGILELDNNLNIENISEDDLNQIVNIILENYFNYIQNPTAHTPEALRNQFKSLLLSPDVAAKLLKPEFIAPVGTFFQEVSKDEHGRERWTDDTVFYEITGIQYEGGILQINYLKNELEQLYVQFDDIKQFIDWFRSFKIITAAAAAAAAAREELELFGGGEGGDPGKKMVTTIQKKLDQKGGTNVNVRTVPITEITSHLTGRGNFIPYVLKLIYGVRQQLTTEVYGVENGQINLIKWSEIFDEVINMLNFNCADDSQLKGLMKQIHLEQENKPLSSAEGKKAKGKFKKGVGPATEARAMVQQSKRKEKRTAGIVRAQFTESPILKYINRLYERKYLSYRALEVISEIYYSPAAIYIRFNAIGQLLSNIGNLMTPLVMIPLEIRTKNFYQYVSLCIQTVSEMLDTIELDQDQSNQIIQSSFQGEVSIYKFVILNGYICSKGEFDEFTEIWRVVMPIVSTEETRNYLIEGDWILFVIFINNLLLYTDITDISFINVDELTQNINNDNKSYFLYLLINIISNNTQEFSELSDQKKSLIINLFRKLLDIYISKNIVNELLEALKDSLIISPQQLQEALGQLQAAQESVQQLQAAQESGQQLQAEKVFLQAQLQELQAQLQEQIQAGQGQLQAAQAHAQLQAAQAQLQEQIQAVQAQYQEWFNGHIDNFFKYINEFSRLDNIFHEALDRAQKFILLLTGQGGGGEKSTIKTKRKNKNKYYHKKSLNDKLIINYLKTNKSSIKSLKDKNRKLKKTYRKKLNKKYKIINKSKRINRIKTKRINRIKTKRINKRINKRNKKRNKK